MFTMEPPTLASLGKLAGGVPCALTVIIRLVIANRKYKLFHKISLYSCIKAKSYFTKV